MENQSHSKKQSTIKSNSPRSEGTGIGGTDISGEDSFEKNEMRPAENTKSGDPAYSKLKDDTDRRDNELI